MKKGQVDRLPKTSLTWRDGMKFEAASESGHHVFLDASAAVGGHNEGIRPMEMVLAALGGCTGIDVLSILNKMRIPYTGFVMELDGQRQDEHPQIYRDITIDYRLEAPEESEEKFRRAVHLSQEKYCSVSAMLATSAQITAQLFLNGRLCETFVHGGQNLES